MTEKERYEVMAQILQEKNEAKQQFTSLEKKLDDIGDHLSKLSKLALREQSFSKDMINEDGDIRIFFKKPPRHTDEEIIHLLIELAEWKKKLHKLEIQLRKCGLDS